jgi:hypothetical protein
MYDGKSCSSALYSHAKDDGIYATYLELDEVTRESSNGALLLDYMTRLLDLWLTQVDKSHSSNIAQSLFPSPLRAVILNKLQSSGRGSSEDSNELVVVDFGRWSSLSSARRVEGTYV